MIRFRRRTDRPPSCTDGLAYTALHLTLATLAQGLARGKGNSPARVAVAKTLHERYQALGGHRVGWFYTNRIRMHGQMRDFESCNQLYEEARSRKVDVDAWFYRAMLIACGQVRCPNMSRGAKQQFPRRIWRFLLWLSQIWPKMPPTCFAGFCVFVRVGTTLPVCLGSTGAVACRGPLSSVCG